MKREEITLSNTPLPSGYRQLEYIESTSYYRNKMSIDTGVLSGETVDFEITVKQKQSINLYFFGARYAHKIDEEGFLWSAQDFPGSPLRFGYGNTMYYFPFTIDEWHTIKMDGDKLYIDNQLATTFNKMNFTRKYNLFLFNANLAGSPDVNDYIAYKQARFWDNNILVRDFVPALRLSDSKPGLYDLCGSIYSVTGTPFYTNTGAGEFNYA